MFKRVFKNSSISWKNYMTVEPAYLLFCLSFYLMDLVNTNLYIQKTCRYNTTIEPDLQTECDDEKAGISFVTSINVKYRFAVKVSHTLLSVFICSWSDRNGDRKLFLMLAIVALIMHLCSLCYQTYYWNVSAEIAVWTEVVFQVFFGGNSLFNTFSKINIFETSNDENRTSRTTILIAIQMMSIPLSSALSGHMMLHLGFFYTYLCCLGLTLASLVLTYLLVHNSVTKPKTDDGRVFNPFLGIISAFKVVFRKRHVKERLSIVLLLVTSTCLVFVTTGERSNIYFFFRYQFHWNERTYGCYLTEKLIIGIFGTLICSLILSKKLKLHDGLIGALATFCLTIGSFGYLLAQNTFELYIVPVFEIFSGVSLSICDSFLSKFFSNEEFGRLFAVHMVFDVITTLGIPAYSIIFNNTMEKFPAAFFLLSLPVNSAGTVLYGILYWLNRHSSQEKS